MNYEYNYGKQEADYWIIHCLNGVQIHYEEASLNYLLVGP